MFVFSYICWCFRFFQGSLGKDHSILPIRKIGEDKYQVFFGYYDISPFNQNGSKLLANRLPKDEFCKSSTFPMEVGFYEIANEKFQYHVIGKTTTWCSQQGCRLQWYPSKSNKHVLYNSIVDDNHGCIIQDIGTKEVLRSLPRAVYSVSNDGKFGLSLNFSRVHRLREGYGYSNFPELARNQLAPENDGIWLVDMITGGDKLLFSVKEMTAFEPMESMKGAEHYFNHLLFNPSGDRFLVFHLWIHNQKRYIRLITSDINGQNRYNLVNEGHVSHYSWLDNRTIIATATHADFGFGYYVYTDQTRNRYRINHEKLQRDGHPSSSNSGLILTDSYPNRWGEQSLYLFFPKQNKLKELGLFYSPPHLEGTLRCDLHPKWDQSGTKICFDSAHQGPRAIYLADISGFLA